VNEDRAVEVIEKHINQNDPIRDYIVYTDLFDAAENDFIRSQIKIVLRNCGYMDPESISDYEERHGYTRHEEDRHGKGDPVRIIKQSLIPGFAAVAGRLSRPA